MKSVHASFFWMRLCSCCKTFSCDFCACVCRSFITILGAPTPVSHATATRWVPSHGHVTQRLASASAGLVLSVASATHATTLLLRSQILAVRVRGLFTILIIWLPLKEKVCWLVVSCPLCSHLWWLPKDHHSGDLVATDKVQPSSSRILPQRFCRCVPVLAGTAVIEAVHIWIESRRFAMFFTLCRCSHQALWRRTRMAGAWTLQLHLTSICGAQCCCMWRLLIYLTN